MRPMQWYKRQRRGTRLFIAWCIVPQVAMFAAVLAVNVAAGSIAASAGQMILWAVWLVSVFTFITIDSRKRWPNTRAIDRVVNVLTFKSR